MQQGFVRWRRGRTDPEPHPWGCKTSSLVLIPEVSLVRDGNELVAVLPRYLLIYPAIFSTAIVTLSEAREWEHT